MHQFQVPRMRDLLSPQLGCLTGLPLQAFHGIFDQFDQTLLENTRAIHASLTNIVRAPFHLAEQCRPLIDEMVAAQRSSNTNITGESSRRDNEGNEDDMVDGHNSNPFALSESFCFLHTFQVIMNSLALVSFCACSIRAWTYNNDQPKTCECGCHH